jgi:MDMPI C-terminal domain
VAMSPDQIMVGDVTGEPEVRVTGKPSNLLLWLWGRAPESAIQVAGDVAVARRLRHRLSLATQ